MIAAQKHLFLLAMLLRVAQETMTGAGGSRTHAILWIRFPAVPLLPPKRYATGGWRTSLAQEIGALRPRLPSHRRREGRGRRSPSHELHRRDASCRFSFSL